MAIRIKVNGAQYPATINGRLHDKDWDNRDSKAITLEMSYADALAMFVNDVEWYIVQDMVEHIEKKDENGNVVLDEHGNPVFEIVTKDEFYDNSDYCIAGDIIDHRDGHVTIKMGKPTAAELLAMLEEVL